MEKFYDEVKKALKKEKKEKVLRIWNDVYENWFGLYPKKFFMTKEDFHARCGCDGRRLSRAKIWDRSLAEYDAKKKYVVIHGRGYDETIESVSKFYSKEFVNLENKDFLELVYDYRYEFGLEEAFSDIK